MMMQQQWSVRLYDVDWGAGQWTHDLVELCPPCAESPPDGVRLRESGPDPHGGACDVCECDEGGEP